MHDTVLNFICDLMENAPWWAYVLVVLVPAFFLLAFREAYCWFNKNNGLYKRLTKIDSTLVLILKELEAARLESDKKNNKIDSPNKFTLKKEEDFKLK